MRLNFSAMSTLKERVQEILEMRQWSARRLCREAELDESHVGALLADRMSDFTTETANAIARAAGVSLHWLVTGQGEREPYETNARPEAVYPSRTAAAEAARKLGISEDAIRRVLASEEQHDRDPGPRYWFAKMQAEDAVRR